MSKKIVLLAAASILVFSGLSFPLFGIVAEESVQTGQIVKIARSFKRPQLKDCEWVKLDSEHERGVRCDLQFPDIYELVTIVSSDGYLRRRYDEELLDVNLRVKPNGIQIHAERWYGGHIELDEGRRLITRFLMDVDAEISTKAASITFLGFLPG